MTDVLSDRFAVLEETSSWDWDDVRHRARRGRLRVALPAAAATVAAVAAAAVAATGGWWFQSSNGHVTAAVQVQLDGRRFDAVVTQRLTGPVVTHPLTATPGPSLCMALVPVTTAPTANACTGKGYPLADPRWLSPTGEGATLLGAGGSVGHDEIWWGPASDEAARVVVEDTGGHDHVARTVAAPAGSGVGRFWVVTFHGRAQRVFAVDANGRVVGRSQILRADAG